MRIIGVWDGHDSGVCVIEDGKILYAANEERFTRRKMEPGFPESSLASALEFTQTDVRQVQHIATSTSHLTKTASRLFPRIEERYYLTRRRKIQPSAANALMKKAKYSVSLIGPNRLTTAISARWLKNRLGRLGLVNCDVEIVSHHHAHAAAATLCSGFARCAVVTLDGIGDGLSGTVNIFRDGGLKTVSLIAGRDSFGIFFEHVTNILNMRELEDEGKVMALANHTYPVEDVENPMMELFEVRGMNVHCRARPRELRGILEKIFWRFPSEQFAYMAQRALEVTVVSLIKNVMAGTGMRRLALAGGVFSNIKLNMLIRRSDAVEECFVFPHMGDGGLAMGAAMAIDNRMNKVSLYELNDLYLGPSFENKVAGAVERSGLKGEKKEQIEKAAAEHIAAGRIVMWFQGRMEAGPRALGNRSVLALPGSLEITRRLNCLMKKRSWFQPFCPSMLPEEAEFFLSDYDGRPNRFMTMGYMTYPERRHLIQGVISADGSCRPQVVCDENPRFRKLLEEVRKLTGKAVVLNTSFNIHGEPIVCTPDDAVRAFADCGADCLVMEDVLVHKA